MDIEFTDRYEGTYYPTKWTRCKGSCQGIGIYPILYSYWLELDPKPVVVPQIDEHGEWEPFPPEDDTLMVFCDHCNGEGRRYTGRGGYYLDLLYTYYYQVYWPLWAFWFELSSGFFAGPHESRLLTALKWAPSQFLFMAREQRRQRAILRRSYG